MKTVLIIGISVVVSVVAVFAIVEIPIIFQQYTLEQEAQKNSEISASLNSIFAKHYQNILKCEWFDFRCQDKIITLWGDDFGKLSEELGFSRAEESEYGNFYLTEFNNTKKQLAIVCTETTLECRSKWTESELKYDDYLAVEHFLLNFGYSCENLEEILTGSKKNFPHPKYESTKNIFEELMIDAKC